MKRFLPTSFLFVLLVLATAMSGGTCRNQRGGSVTIRNGTNSVSVTQGENASTPTTQNYTREHTKKFVIPAGTVMVAPSSKPTPATNTANARADMDWGFVSDQLRTMKLSKDVTFEETERETHGATIGAAQDSGLKAARVLGARTAALRPVMYLGIAFILGAGALAYFGWYTKAILSGGIGIGVIAIAYFLPQIPTWVIVLCALVTFAVVALLVLYVYHKGKLDANGDGKIDLKDVSGILRGVGSEATNVVNQVRTDNGNATRPG